MQKTSRPVANRYRSLLLLLFIALLSLAVQRPALAGPATSCLWSIDTGHNTVYLLGSMHMLKADAYPLADVIENAYRGSGTIIFETDIGAMESPETQAQFLASGMYGGTETLQQNVSPDTYQLLSEKSAAMGLPVAALDRFRPWMCGLTLATVGMQQLGFDPNLGVDRYFFTKARQDGKTIAFFESTDFQIHLFADLSPSDQELFLEQSIKDLETLSETIPALAKAWQDGDIKALNDLTQGSFAGFPDIYARFITSRNHNWQAKLEELLAGEDNAMVVVGTGHLVGPGSVVELLRRRGYEVEQL